MCFSAGVSFSAGIILTAIGIATIKKTKHPSQIFFASIPLVFGVQQIAEGFLWMTLPNPELRDISRVFSYIFILFAQIIWPIWTPISILLLEKKATRSRFQIVLVGAGMVVGCYLFYCLLSFPIEAKIVEHHIVYYQEYPVHLKMFVILFYALATVAPTFFSHIKKMWVLGLTIFVSYVFTEIFYDQYMLSVWCFFSSIISVSVYFIIVHISKGTAKMRLEK